MNCKLSISLALLCLTVASFANAQDIASACPELVTETASAEQLNRCAEDLLERRFPGVAREVLQVALTRAGNDPACRASIETNLGDAAWRESEHATAAQHFETAITQLRASRGARSTCDVDHLREHELRARLGAALVRSGTDGVRRALAQYDVIAAAGPASSSGLALLSNIAGEAFRQGDLTTARTAAERLLREAGSNSDYAPSANRILAEVAQREKRFADAVRHYEQTLAAHNVSNLTQTLATRGLAESYLALGRRDDALRVISNAVAGALKRDELLAALQTRGWIRIQMGDPASLEAALQDYATIRQMDASPVRTAQALTQEGYIYTTLGRWSDALTTYDRLEDMLLEVDNLSSEAGILSLHDVRVALAQAQARSGRGAEAAVTLDEALVTPGKTTPAQIQLQIATLRFNERNYAGARDALREALRNDPASPQARSTRALLAHSLFQLNDLAGAITEAEAAVSMGYPDPRDPERLSALRLAANARYQMRDYRGAIQRFDELTPLTGRDEDRVAHGGTYLLLDPPDYDNALRLYSTITDPAARAQAMRNVHLGRAQRAYCASRFRDAAAEYRQMIAIANNDAEAAQARMLAADAEFAQLLYEYAQAGRTPPPSAEQRARIATIDAEYAAAQASPDQQRRAIVRRGDLAFMAYDWDTAERFYRDPALTAAERATVAPRLNDIRRLRTPGVLLREMAPVTEYANFSGCPK